MRHGEDDGMAAWLILEAALCTCVGAEDEVCTCGWDDEEPPQDRLTIHE